MGIGIAEEMIISSLATRGVISRDKPLPPGRSLLDSLLRLGVSEDKLAQILEEEMGIPWIDPVAETPDIELLRLIPGERWWEWQAVPLILQGDAETRPVALANPLSIGLVDTIRREVSKKLGQEVAIKVFAASPRRIAAALINHYPELKSRQSLEATAIEEFRKALSKYVTIPPEEDPIAFLEKLPPKEQDRIYALIAREVGMPLLREQVSFDLAATRERSLPSYLAEYLGALVLVGKPGRVVLMNPYMRPVVEQALVENVTATGGANWVLAPPHIWRGVFELVYPSEIDIDADEVLSVFEGEDTKRQGKKLPFTRDRKPFSRFLVEKGLITEEVAEKATEAQRTTRISFEEFLLNNGYVSQEELAKALAEWTDTPLVDPIAEPPDFSLLDKFNWLTESYASQHKVLPYKLEDGVLYILVANPRDYTLIDHFRFFAGDIAREVKPVVATRDAIDRLITNAFRADVQYLVEDLFEEVPGEEEETGDEGAVSDSAAARIVNQLIESAITEGASDLHIEPRPKQTVVRIRVDGALHELTELPKGAHNQVVARIKVLARMDLAEKRKPQDGRIVYRNPHRRMAVDLRVSVVPTVYGEKVVMRLLQKAENIPEIEGLGFRDEVLEKFKRVISKPYGIILITGPTGSGKSFTTFSILKRISTPDKNTMTVEDPVEYEIPGINQVQVNPKAGLTFASALRAFLRQDPDIIMVGEIRDAETAKIATEAALTGHLVIATLHTNDAAGAITRLEELGVERFNIAASLLAVLAQRLVRRVCRNCRVEDQPGEDILEALELTRDVIQGKKLYKGAGCERCRGTGYRGRMPIHELLVVDEAIRKAIVAGKTDTEIKELARQRGMYTLREDGIFKALEGHTTLEEVLARTIE